MAGVVRVLLLLVSATVVEVQNPGRATCRLEIDSARIALSGELRLTMVIEGPAPMEVDVPSTLTLSHDWLFRAERASTSPLGNGRERWTQSFVFTPFQVGSVPLKLEPVRFRIGNEVLDWPLTWKPLEIQVDSMVKDPARDAPRPVTGIDELPPIPSESRTAWYTAGLAIAILVVAILIGWRWRRRTAAEEPSPFDRVVLELEKLEKSGPTPEQLPHLADVLRRFLDSQLPLRATRQTTSEFLVSLRQVDGIDPGCVEKVAAVLMGCDLAKFAAVTPDNQGCQRLLTNAREAVAQLGRPGPTRSTK